MCGFVLGTLALGIGTRSGDAPEDWRSHVFVEAVAGDADHEARAQAEGAYAALWLVGGALPSPVRIYVPPVHDDSERRELAYTSADAAAPLIPLIEQWQDWSVILMLRIGKCECGLDPSAIGGPNDDGLYDYGVWQLHGDERGLDPVIATEIAHEKFVAAKGYSPWASSQRCWG